MSRLKRAVLIFEEDAAIPADAKPLMLETVLSRPILSWVCDRLRNEGVQRLFAVCGPRFAGEVREVLPPEAAVSEVFRSGPGVKGPGPQVDGVGPVSHRHLQSLHVPRRGEQFDLVHGISP